MKKILITGSQGLLGSSLVPHLQTAGFDLTTHTRREKSNTYADLTNKSEVKSLLDKVTPEIIINLVALTNVDECEKNPHSAYLSNVKTVENIADWIKLNNNQCHLIHLSTDQVYDGVGPHKEHDIVLTNYYAFSKMMSEQVVAGIPSTILRTNFFGPSQCKHRKSLSDWLLESFSQGRTITVFDDISFSPLSIKHLIELIELIILKPQKGVFNLGSKEGMSKADFAFALAEVLQLPTYMINRGKSNAVKLNAYRPKDMRLDSSYFENSFNVKLPSLVEEIQSMKNAYAIHGNK